MATQGQIKKLHALKGALKLDDDTYRAALAAYGAASSKDRTFTMEKADDLIDHWEKQAIAAGVWQSRQAGYKGRPRNIEHGSRAEQLKKIEALLTIGKLPWSYADAIARQMRLADKIAWVKDHELFKIITALRKKAQKEGWDLSGETR